MPARRQSGGPGPLHKVLASQPASQPASLSVPNDYSFSLLEGFFFLN